MYVFGITNEKMAWIWGWDREMGKNKRVIWWNERDFILLNIMIFPLSTHVPSSPPALSTWSSALSSFTAVYMYTYTYTYRCLSPYRIYVYKVMLSFSYSLFIAFLCAQFCVVAIRFQSCIAWVEGKAFGGILRISIQKINCLGTNVESHFVK